MPLDLHEHLYALAYKRAKSVMGAQPVELSSYEAAFLASLPKSFDVSTSDELLAAIGPGSLVLFGDFHSLPASQRRFRELMASLHAGVPKHVVVALECFESSDQPAIDAFLAGAISEGELLRATNFHISWGFAWAPYRAILRLARQKGIAVMAVNHTAHGSNALAKRDYFMAKKLLHIQIQHPHSIVLCLVGEQHLGDDHLPRMLKALLAPTGVQRSTVRIVSNVDHYYFELLGDKGHQNIGCLKLAPEFFCLIGEPPWYKWLSYNLWVDCLQLEAEHGVDEPSYNALSAEIDEYFLDLLRLINAELGLACDEDDLINFHVRIRAPGARPKAGLARGVKTPEEASLWPRDYDFDPRTNTVRWLAFSWNGLIEAAGEFLYHCAYGRHLADVCSPTSRAARRIAGGLVLRYLNPLAMHQHFPRRRQRSREARLKRIVSACHSPDLLESSRPSLVNAESVLTSRITLNGMPEDERDDLCYYVADELHRLWQNEGTLLGKLQTLLQQGDVTGLAVLQKSLASLEPRPPKQPERRAIGRGGKTW